MSSANISVQSPPTVAVSTEVISDISTARAAIKRVHSLDDMSSIIDQVANGFTTVTGKKSRRLDKSRVKSTLNSANVGKPTPHFSSQLTRRHESNVSNVDNGTHRISSPGRHSDFNVSTDSIIDLLDKVSSAIKITIATQSDLSGNDLCMAVRNATLTGCDVDAGTDVLSTSDCFMVQNIEKCMLSAMSPLSSDVIALQ